MVTFSDLMSLFLRHPEALDRIKGQLRESVQGQYERTRKVGEPERFEDSDRLMETNELGRLHGSLLIDLIQYSKFGRWLNNLFWGIANLESAGHELLTSDRPIVLNGFPIAGIHSSLPVSPSKMFFACDSASAYGQFQAMKRKRYEKGTALVAAYSYRLRSSERNVRPALHFPAPATGVSPASTPAIPATRHRRASVSGAAVGRGLPLDPVDDPGGVKRLRGARGVKMIDLPGKLHASDVAAELAHLFAVEL
jgi:hypothetical protein